MTSRPTRLLWANLGAVYLVWGSTYLAIRVMVETVPPLLGTGLRFLVAGALLAVVLEVRHRTRPLRVTRAELFSASVTSVLILVGGIGLLTTRSRRRRRGSRP